MTPFCYGPSDPTTLIRPLPYSASVRERDSELGHPVGAAAFSPFIFAHTFRTHAAAATKATTTSFFAANKPASNTLKSPALVARAPATRPATP